MIRYRSSVAISRIASWCRAIALLALCTPLSLAVGKEEAQPPFRYYYVYADVVSLDAKQSLASYTSHGHVDGAPGSKIGCSTPDTTINIALSVESERLVANIELTPDAEAGKDKDAAGKKDTKLRLDLTNLEPTSVDVGSKDGRTYRLNLVPTVKTVTVKPKPFQEIADDLYTLRFHSSRLMLNDKQFIGRMLASNSQFFSVYISGLADIEFSLRHLKDAEPWGRLSDGNITIANPDGTTIEINNVTNGAQDRVIEGGPYTVWVRWKKPTTTAEEYRAALESQRDQLKAAAAAADLGDTARQALEILEQELKREPGPWVIGCGAGDPPKSEFVNDK